MCVCVFDLFCLVIFVGKNVCLGPTHCSHRPPTPPLSRTRKHAQTQTQTRTHTHTETHTCTDGKNVPRKVHGATQTMGVVQTSTPKLGRCREAIVAAKATRHHRDQGGPEERNDPTTRHQRAMRQCAGIMKSTQKKTINCDRRTPTKHRNP